MPLPVCRRTRERDRRAVVGGRFGSAGDDHGRPAGEGTRATVPGVTGSDLAFEWPEAGANVKPWVSGGNLVVAGELSAGIVVTAGVGPVTEPPGDSAVA